MTAHEPATDPIGPVVEYQSLQNRDGVPYHENEDEVDAAVVEQVAAAEDLAGVGVTNDDGDLLFRRLTDTCSWKIPLESVGPDADFAAQIRDHVRETVGFDLALDGIAGVWELTVRTADGEQEASRAFVIFSATPTAGEYDLAAVTPEGDPVEAADWFGDYPPDADEVPGTDQFLDGRV